MFEIGSKITLRIPNLYYNNIHIRIDESVSAITGTSIPQGASGEIEAVEKDEIKISLYWNPSNIPGSGHDIIIWVKKVIFANSFEYL